MNDITNDHLSLTRASTAEKYWMSEEFTDIDARKDPNNPFISVPHPKSFFAEGRVNMRPFFYMTQPVIRKIIEDTFSKRSSSQLFDLVSTLIKYHDEANEKQGKDWIRENIISKPEVIRDFDSYFIKPYGSYDDKDQLAHRLAKSLHPISPEAFYAYANLMEPANQKFKCELDSGEVFKNPVYSAGAVLGLLNLCRTNRRDEDPFRTREWQWIECGNQYLMSTGSAQNLIDRVSGSNGDRIKWERINYPIPRVAAYLLGGIFKELDLTSLEKVGAFQQKIGRMTEYLGAAKTLYLLNEKLKRDKMDDSISDSRLAIDDLKNLLIYKNQIQQYGSLTDPESKLLEALSDPAVIKLIDNIIKDPKKHRVNTNIEPTRSTWNVVTKADTLIDSSTFVERLARNIKACAEMFTAA